MTLPTLIQKQNNRVTEVRLQKFYSIFNQALQMSVRENGDISTWDCWDSHGYIDPWANSLEKYIVPYMKIIDASRTVTFSPATSEPRRLYVLSDGTSFIVISHEVIFFPKNAEACFTDKNGYGDINFGVCAFNFDVRQNKNVLDFPSWLSCDVNHPGVSCTELIAKNGWKVPDDYPKRIKY